MEKDEIKEILERCFLSYSLAVTQTVTIRGEQIQLRDLIKVYTKFVAKQGFHVDINID